MGRQSQQRVANQTKRKYKLCSNNNNRKKKKGDQLTLDNRVAFQPERDCVICKAREIRKFMPEHAIPKRSHDPRCSLNTKTRGLGQVTEQSVASLADNRRHKALTAPIKPAERHSAKHISKAAGEKFFAARAKTMTKGATTTSKPNMPVDLPPLQLSKAV